MSFAKFVVGLKVMVLKADSCCNKSSFKDPVKLYFLCSDLYCFYAKSKYNEECSIFQKNFLEKGIAIRYNMSQLMAKQRSSRSLGI